VLWLAYGGALFPKLSNCTFANKYKWPACWKSSFQQTLQIAASSLAEKLLY
jgi:hypothetical protein